ncbi:hypothetical protein [Microbacterium sp. 179-I 3D3 NHS]|uniref:hypothetical protein n=1 Tax=unclassified Microbacterium TaxID=2609290 RepID=UPI00399F0FBC
MDHVLPAAPWLMAAAALVSAAACIAAWRAVPWQGRQTALVMAAAMVLVAVTDGNATTGLAIGVILVLSAMLGTMGVRGRPSAATCCHRALVSLVMAVCSFESASVVGAAAQAGAAPATVAGHGAHGMTGILSVMVIVGVIAVVLWTVVAEWIVAPTHSGRTARLLAVESWAMAAGVAVMCLGF